MRWTLISEISAPSYGGPNARIGASAGPMDRLRNRCLRTHGEYGERRDLPELLVEDAGEWRRWSNADHADSLGVWLVLAKKGTAYPTTLLYDEALDEAICFGWIDGQLGRRDTATFRDVSRLEKLAARGHNETLPSQKG